MTVLIDFDFLCPCLILDTVVPRYLSLISSRWLLKAMSAKQINHVTYHMILCFGWEGLPVCPFFYVRNLPSNADFLSALCSCPPLFLLQHPSRHGRLCLFSAAVPFFLSQRIEYQTNDKHRDKLSSQNASSTKFDEFWSSRVPYSVPFPILCHLIPSVGEVWMLSFSMHSDWVKFSQFCSLIFYFPSNI